LVDHLELEHFQLHPVIVTRVNCSSVVPVLPALFGIDILVPSCNHHVTVSDIVIKHLIELGVGILLVTAIAALHRPLSGWLKRLSPTPVAQVSWWSILISTGPAMLIITVQLVFFNDPTAVVMCQVT
jgi:hypothetical protein